MKHKTANRLDETRAVAAILDQIPELLKVKQVRKRDGSLVGFAAEKIGMSLSGILKDAGVNDETLLARCTHQALMRIDREFDGHTVPTTDDLARVVALVLIDNNLPFAVKKYFQSIATDAGVAHKVISKGVRFRRRFTRNGVHPYDEIEWDLRDAVITNEKGKIVFEQRGIEVPKSWSQTATNIVVSKYFRGEIGKPERETSVRQMVDRVAKTIANWGRDGGYFSSEEDAETFEMELTHILVNQKAAFNSPVWFNVGVNPKPQCSACFINSVRDDMRSILTLAVTEGMLFKYGSGTGSNLSTLRSSKEKLAHSSGKSSGPVSFMKGFDAFAGVIKSGGKTRRAAKMVILNVDHPDVEEFVECKAKEEQKAHTLIANGYDSSIDGDAYGSIFFQNANNSVRVSDDFMRAVEEDGMWETKAVTSGETVDRMRARDLMRKISKAAWECGDPGMQYDTTINRWHPTPNSGRINASNPCSEYMFLDDTACNLASLNLMKFRREDGSWDVDDFIHTTEVVITAQEIVVGASSYPTPAIEENSFDFRPLGIGYANLGALLMSRGLAYDSDEGRNFAAAVTSLLSGHSYYQSAKIAEALGSFRYYKLNEKPFLKVIGMHRDHAYSVPSEGVPSDLLRESRRAWDNALEHGMTHGYKNAQISVLAPTGTIGFLMDCDTTGIEPDIALVKYKWLVGGGLMKIVNQTVPDALAALGYGEGECKDILDYIDKNDTIEGAPHLKEEHLAVFDCAFKPSKGERSIQYMGHIRMMSAVQPFLSGAISKTVNLPANATVEDVEDAYVQGWRLGLKAIAIYRDGSKGQQVLTTTAEKNADKKNAPAAAPAEVRIEYRPLRRRLPDERKSVTHKFSVGGHEGYITVGLYDDGEPGELFIRMSKGGSVVSGLMDAFATSTSIAMQYGVPLKVLANKFVHVRFEPSGFTSHPNIRIAKSIVDYLFRWMAIKFLSPEEQRALGVNMDVATLGETGEKDVAASANVLPTAQLDPVNAAVPAAAQMKIADGIDRAKTANALTMSFDVSSDAPACDTCGAIMVRSAACYKCLNCGSTSGCS
ncbi:MAG TPA: vitamin B12-dependent ribonucleotide reductase [Candidatus Eisenbacteria bacterium]|nr:vitamin B12-dependent ribonucleotide reductase [Candidatus Eisenbacteria bacterium]